jgi:hypothetical protein
MSAGVFPPTSSRSTRPRTSYAHAGVRGLCGLHDGTVSQRIVPGISATAGGSAGSHRWFPGGPGSFPGIGRVQHGQPDRPGANGAFCLSGPHLLPEPVTLLSPRALPGSLPSPCVARARRCSPSALLSPSSAHSPGPPCFGPGSACFGPGRPLSGFCPEPALCVQSPPLSSPSSALRACVLAGRKRAFACGVPGALRGTWVSSTRFDEMNDPCPRNVLI